MMFDIAVVMWAPRVVGVSILWHSWTTNQWNRPVPPLHSQGCSQNRFNENVYEMT